MDIQAPYITEMMRKGYCDEYDAYYGIDRRKQVEDKAVVKRFTVEIVAINGANITANSVREALSERLSSAEVALGYEIYEGIDVEEE